MLASDHGMEDGAASGHAAAARSSWNPVLAFYGPGMKRGATIPYAELPDVAVTVAHLLGLRPLRGLLDPAVTLPVRGPTGTVLTNLFEGAPDELPHPRYIERCLQTGTACTSEADDYAAYRQTMLGSRRTVRRLSQRGCLPALRPALPRPFALAPRSGEREGRGAAAVSLAIAPLPYPLPAARGEGKR